MYVLFQRPSILADPISCGRSMLKVWILTLKTPPLGKCLNDLASPDLWLVLLLELLLGDLLDTFVPYRTTVYHLSAGNTGTSMVCELGDAAPTVAREDVVADILNEIEVLMVCADTRVTDCKK